MEFNTLKDIKYPESTKLFIIYTKLRFQNKNQLNYQVQVLSRQTVIEEKCHQEQMNLAKRNLAQKSEEKKIKKE